MRSYCFLAMMVWSLNLLALETDDSSQLNADGGQLRLYTFYPLLEKYGIIVHDAVKTRHPNWEQNPYITDVKTTGGLQLYAPHGGLKAVTGGQLYLTAEFAWQLPSGGRIDFKQLQIRPTTQPLNSGDLTKLDVFGGQGQLLFTMDHVHAGFDANNSQMFMENMDWRISPWLADHINIPELANHVMGQANLTVNLTIPPAYQPKPHPLGSCSAGGNWPPGNPDVDVALIDIEEASYLDDVGADHIIITPSATLENVGTADVAWYRKFFGNFAPYNNDQHPYLIWNLYREIDGRFEQIGASGVKHAFYTVNTICACAGGQVLFPTCQDKYSISNNHSPTHIGPREGIEAFTGLWESTGSFFDQNSDGVQDTYSNGLGQNRMVVPKADLNQNQVNYYLSAWYLIRDDINIYNNMGHKQYDITPNGSAWSVEATSGYHSGPASNQYVAVNSSDLKTGEASQRILRSGEGHLTVATKIFNLGGGTYRYNYMIENHDYDPQVQTISFPLDDFSPISDVVFSDIDSDSNNDWVITRTKSQLQLQAPAGNEIDWGTLYSFSFTTNAQPVYGHITLTGFENNGDTFQGQLLVPLAADLIFVTSFE